MKIQASSPSRAAAAATAFARLPVDAQPTTVRPKAWAAFSALATTRSLNESDGNDPASCLTRQRETPNAAASRGASTSGVQPAFRQRTGLPVNGSHSRYRQSDRG